MLDLKVGQVLYCPDDEGFGRGKECEFEITKVGRKYAHTSAGKIDLHDDLFIKTWNHRVKVYLSKDHYLLHMEKVKCIKMIDDLLTCIVDIDTLSLNKLREFENYLIELVKD